MEVSDIFSNDSVGVRRGCPILFSVFLEKLMQKSLTPQRQSKDDPSVGNSEEVDTSLSSVTHRFVT